jgi:hypothetical protein
VSRAVLCDACGALVLPGDALTLDSVTGPLSAKGDGEAWHEIEICRECWRRWPEPLSERARELLRDAMTAEKLDKHALAARLGVAYQAVDQVIWGHQITLQLATLRRYAEALGYDVVIQLKKALGPGPEVGE